MIESDTQLNGRNLMKKEKRANVSQRWPASFARLTNPLSVRLVRIDSTYFMRGRLCSQVLLDKRLILQEGRSCINCGEKLLANRRKILSPTRKVEGKACRRCATANATSRQFYIEWGAS